MTKRQLLVAVVDDELSIRKALRRLLRSAGMDAEVFASGADFLEYMKNNLPDCLLLDLHLPGLTGRDVLRRLREARSSLPAIIITGHDQPGVGEELLAAGAAAYLTKPLNEQDLMACMTAAVRPSGRDSGSE